MPSVLRMSEVDLAGKRVLVRADLNVPAKDGAVTSDTRIRATLPTLEQALAAGARVMVMSHLGRPEEGRYDERYSLAPVAERLSALLERPVRLAREWLDGVEVAEGECVLCENVRFLAGETADDEGLARRMAALCDVFVMDAFGTAHRAHASTHGVARRAPVACAGPLLAAELEALARAMEAPARPLVAVVGGAKVSSKLALLENLCARVERLIVGGGIANTFIAAAGQPVGRSLYEPGLVETAGRLARAAREAGGGIPMPVDVAVAAAASPDAAVTVKPVGEVTGPERILDIGPETAAHYAEMVAEAGTVVWNGPLGMFEIDAFGAGTRALATAIAESHAYSLAGGGDTVAAIEKYGVADRISYISTGGGAFLEFLEGKTLPAVAALEARAGGRPAD